MADLAKVLSDLSGNGTTIFQAVVSALGTGVVDLTYNGGTYTAVPYIAGGFAPATGPAVGNQVYVIGRKDWGGLVIGKAPTGPTRTVAAVTADDWDPYALAAYNLSTKGWTIAGGDLVLAPAAGSSLGSLAVAFFRPVDTPFTAASALGTATVHLGVTSVAIPDDALAARDIRARMLSGQQFFWDDWTWYGCPAWVSSWNDYLDSLYTAQGGNMNDHNKAAAWLLGYYNDRSSANLELGLHLTAAPTGTLLQRSETLTVRLKAGQTAEVPLPLSWVTALLGGAAQGITARPLNYATTVSGPGIVHLTSL